MASPSRNESDEVFEDTQPRPTKAQLEEDARRLLMSPIPGEGSSGEDTEDEEGQVTARPASQDSDAGYPTGGGALDEQGHASGRVGPGS